MTAILFDFFGTLVSYSPSRTEQGYPRTHALVPHLSYDGFLATLDEHFVRCETASLADNREFAMTEPIAALLGRSVTDPAVAEFERVYLSEWAAGVAYPDGLETLLGDLRTRHRLAVVSNTHSPVMVPALLARAGLTAMFDAVVLSVDVGRRKPHPAVYAAALDALGVPASEAIFVGDTYDADYAGPIAAGLRAYLIDPDADIPDEHRLTSVFDLPARLAWA
jgi:putative hydrolase of the HAD superfamily